MIQYLISLHYLPLIKQFLDPSTGIKILLVEILGCMVRSIGVPILWLNMVISIQTVKVLE